MNCPRRQRIDEARFYWEGVAGWRAEGKGTLYHKAHSLRFYRGGVSFQVVSGRSSCLAYIWSDSVLLAGMSISQPREIPAWRILGGWQDKWAGISSLLLLSPPKSSLLVFSGISLLFMGTAYHETTQASNYYQAWPWQAVSVNIPQHNRTWLHSWTLVENGGPPPSQ